MPLPGDFGVVATGGWVARCIRKITRSTVNHAFVYVGDGRIVEAQPRGAVKGTASEYPNAIWSDLPLTDQERLHIVARALSLVGTPYSFLDIAVQAFVRVFGWHAPGWVLRRLATRKRLQCAQLVEVAYLDGAHIDLASKADPFGLIIPGDLLDIIKETVHGS